MYIENIFVCMAAPLAVALLFLPKASRPAVIFCLGGMASCLLAAYLNTFFALYYRADGANAATQVAPVVEEILKLLPLLFYLAVFQPEAGRFRLAAIVLAASFATFENVCWLADLVIRGFGTGAMHVVCGSFYGGALGPVWDERPLRAACILGLLCAAVIYHAIYNLLVSAGGAVQTAAYLLPLLTAAVFRLVSRKKGCF